VGLTFTINKKTTNMELEGTLVQVMEPQGGTTKTGNPWKKQDFLLEVPGQYPKKALFTVWGDKVNFAEYPTGTKLKVSFDLDAREYNGRWYNDVKAWKVESGGDENQVRDAPMQDSFPPEFSSPAGSDDNDLPF